MHSKNLKNIMHCEVMINQVPSVFRFSLIRHTQSSKHGVSKKLYKNFHFDNRGS